MFFKLKNKYVKTVIDLNIPATIQEQYIRGIYKDCLEVWNMDKDDVVSFAGVDSIVVGKSEVKKLGNEPRSHAILKFYAEKWLRGRGHDKIEFEHSGPGWRADVACPGARIAIECGGVEDISKVSRGVANGWTVCLMPYQTSKILYGLNGFEELHHITIFGSRGIKLESVFRFMTEEEIDRMHDDDIKIRNASYEKWFEENPIDFNKIVLPGRPQETIDAWLR